MKTKADRCFRACACKTVFCVILLVFASLAAIGCKTASIDQRLASHPADYQRITVLPVCFEAAGEQATTEREAGARLASALTNCLAAKGYCVVGTVRVLSSSDDWASLGPDTYQVLRRQFELGRLVSEWEKTNLLYECGFGSHLADLQRGLNLPEADAVMLLNCATINPSVPKPPKTVRHITGFLLLMIGAPALDFSGSEMFDDSVPYKPINAPVFVESVEFNVTIFDPHNQQIIFNNFNYALRNDLAKERKLRARVRALLKDLPKIKQPRRNEP